MKHIQCWACMHHVNASFLLLLLGPGPLVLGAYASRLCLATLAGFYEPRERVSTLLHLNSPSRLPCVPEGSNFQINFCLRLADLHSFLLPCWRRKKDGLFLWQSHSHLWGVPLHFTCQPHMRAYSTFIWEVGSEIRFMHQLFVCGHPWKLSPIYFCSCLYQLPPLTLVDPCNFTRTNGQRSHTFVATSCWPRV